MRGAIAPLPQYVFMGWCSIKKSTGKTLRLPFTLSSSQERELVLRNEIVLDKSAVYSWKLIVWDLQSSILLTSNVFFTLETTASSVSVSSVRLNFMQLWPLPENIWGEVWVCICLSQNIQCGLSGLITRSLPTFAYEWTDTVRITH